MQNQNGKNLVNKGDTYNVYQFFINDFTYFLHNSC